MIRLQRTDASRYQSLDPAAQKARFDRLQSLLRDASPATKSVFAEPAAVQGSTQVDWYSRLGGQPQRLSALAEADANAARARLDDALNDVARIANVLEGTSADDAAFLRAAARYPSDDDVFVLNGHPVVAGWGHGMAGRQPLGPVAAATAATVAATGGAVAASSGRWWRVLLLLLALSLALAVAAWWYFRDFAWPPWFDYAAFHESAARNEDELEALAGALDRDIETLLARCTPPPGAAFVAREAQQLRERVSELDGRIATQASVYQHANVAPSERLQKLQPRPPAMAARITQVVDQCAAIAEEQQRREAEEQQRREEEERQRQAERDRQQQAQAEAAKREEQKKRAEREVDEFDKRRANAGGKEGELTVTLLWNTVDDLDLHIHCPNRAHIYYKDRSGCGGSLDVDKNARDPLFGFPQGPVTREPIENVYWSQGSAAAGKYRIQVNLFKEGTRSRGSRPFKIKVQKGEDVQYFEGEVSSGNRDAYFDFSYP